MAGSLAACGTPPRCGAHSVPCGALSASPTLPCADPSACAAVAIPEDCEDLAAVRCEALSVRAKRNFGVMWGDDGPVDAANSGAESWVQARDDHGRAREHPHAMLVLESHMAHWALRPLGDSPGLAAGATGAAGN